MSRKKRNKKYQGRDAKIEKPVIKRYSVEDTSKFQRWWQDNKPEVILRGVQVGAILIFASLLWWLISLFF